MINNCCRFIGRLVRDVELKHTPNNVPVATFVLAVDRERPDADGNYKSDFITFVVWRKLAEIVCEKYKKGDLISVLGSLQPRSYKDKDGITHYNAEVIVQECRKISAYKKAASVSENAPEAPPVPSEESFAALAANEPSPFDNQE